MKRLTIAEAFLLGRTKPGLRFSPFGGKDNKTLLLAGFLDLELAGLVEITRDTIGAVAPLNIMEERVRSQDRQADRGQDEKPGKEEGEQSNEQQGLLSLTSAERKGLAPLYNETVAKAGRHRSFKEIWGGFRYSFADKKLRGVMAALGASLTEKGLARKSTAFLGYETYEPVTGAQKDFYDEVRRQLIYGDPREADATLVAAMPFLENRNASGAFLSKEERLRLNANLNKLADWLDGEYDEDPWAEEEEETVTEAADMAESVAAPEDMAESAAEATDIATSAAAPEDKAKPAAAAEDKAKPAAEPEDKAKPAATPEDKAKAAAEVEKKEKSATGAPAEKKETDATLMKKAMERAAFVVLLQSYGA